MPKMENLRTPGGPLARRAAPVTSPLLLALPEDHRPKTIIACVACPNGSWSLSEKLRLTCLCAARRYMSWTPTTDGLIMCDDRAAALAEQDEPT